MPSNADRVLRVMRNERQQSRMIFDHRELAVALLDAALDLHGVHRLPRKVAVVGACGGRNQVVLILVLTSMAGEVEDGALDVAAERVCELAVRGCQLLLRAVELHDDIKAHLLELLRDCLGGCRV